MQVVGRDLYDTMRNMRLRLGTGYGMSNKEMRALLDQIGDELPDRELREARRDAVAKLSSISEGFMGTSRLARMGSHAALSEVCGAIHEPEHGWTKPACRRLIDRLTWLLGS